MCLFAYIGTNAPLPEFRKPVGHRPFRLSGVSRKHAPDALLPLGSIFCAEGGDCSCLLLSSKDKRTQEARAYFSEIVRVARERDSRTLLYFVWLGDGAENPARRRNVPPEMLLEDAMWDEVLEGPVIGTMPPRQAAARG